MVKFFGFISMLLDRIFVVIGAFLGSQIPPFMQQYTQRLAGHVEELHYLIEQLRRSALSSNKTLEQYIEKFISNPDQDFHNQGEFMQEIVVRWEKLNQAFFNLETSTVWSRPYFFIKDMQEEIVRSTWDSFQPGFSLTLEGGIYTGIGILAGFLFYQLILACLQALKKIPKVLRNKS